MAEGIEKVDFGKISFRIPILVEKLSAFPEVAAVYLFGSFARRKARRTSDVDIAVLTAVAGTRPVPASASDYAAAASAALGTDRLDLVVLNAAPAALRHEVLRHGKPVFLRDPAVLARFREESMRRYLDTMPLRREYEAAYFRRIREKGFARQSPNR